MIKLTHQEFIDRLMAVAEAEKVFVHSGITNNISVAFSLYQKLLADKERALILDSKEQDAGRGVSIPSAEISIPVDIELEKPRCPDCDKELMLRVAKNEEIDLGAKSVWFCASCGYEGMSEKSVMRWIRELPEKGAEEVIVESRAEKEDVSGG